MSSQHRFRKVFHFAAELVVASNAVASSSINNHVANGHSSVDAPLAAIEGVMISEDVDVVPKSRSMKKTSVVKTPSSQGIPVAAEFVPSTGKPSSPTPVVKETEASTAAVTEALAPEQLPDAVEPLAETTVECSNEPTDVASQKPLSETVAVVDIESVGSQRLSSKKPETEAQVEDATVLSQDPSNIPSSPLPVEQRVSSKKPSSPLPVEQRVSSKKPSSPLKSQHSIPKSEQVKPVSNIKQSSSNANIKSGTKTSPSESQQPASQQPASQQSASPLNDQSTSQQRSSAIVDTPTSTSRVNSKVESSTAAATSRNSQRTRSTSIVIMSGNKRVVSIVQPDATVTSTTAKVTMPQQPSETPNMTVSVSQSAAHPHVTASPVVVTAANGQVVPPNAASKSDSQSVHVWVMRNRSAHINNSNPQASSIPVSPQSQDPHLSDRRPGELVMSEAAREDVMLSECHSRSFEGRRSVERRSGGFSEQRNEQVSEQRRSFSSDRPHSQDPIKNDASAADISLASEKESKSKALSKPQLTSKAPVSQTNAGIKAQPTSHQRTSQGALPSKSVFTSKQAFETKLNSKSSTAKSVSSVNQPSTVASPAQRLSGLMPEQQVLISVRTTPRVSSRVKIVSSKSPRFSICRTGRLTSRAMNGSRSVTGLRSRLNSTTSRGARPHCQHECRQSRVRRAGLALLMR